MAAGTVMATTDLRGDVPIPQDVAAVLETFRQLGDAARRGLHVAEQHARHQVREAARRAAALAGRVAGQGARRDETQRRGR